MRSALPTIWKLALSVLPSPSHEVEGEACAGWSGMDADSVPTTAPAWFSATLALDSAMSVGGSLTSATVIRDRVVIVKRGGPIVGGANSERERSVRLVVELRTVQHAQLARRGIEREGVARVPADDPANVWAWPASGSVTVTVPTLVPLALFSSMLKGPPDTAGG